MATLSLWLKILFFNLLCKLLISFSVSDSEQNTLCKWNNTKVRRIRIENSPIPTQSTTLTQWRHIPVRVRSFWGVVWWRWWCSVQRWRPHRSEWSSPMLLGPLWEGMGEGEWENKGEHGVNEKKDLDGWMVWMSDHDRFKLTVFWKILALTAWQILDIALHTSR